MSPVSSETISLSFCIQTLLHHYSDVIMSAMASQFTGYSFVCLTVIQRQDESKHQSSASPVPARGNPAVTGGSLSQRAEVTRKVFPFDDAIMIL